MAYTPGDFSPSVMGDIIIKEQNMLNGEGRTLSELNQSIVAGASILAHQDPEIIERFEGQKCISAKVVALRATDNALSETSDTPCVIPSSDQLGSESLTLEKELLTNPYLFTINESQCNNAFSWDDRMTYNLMKGKALLEVALSKKLVALAATNADVPLTDWFAKTTGTVVGNSFNVATADFTSDLYADLMYASQITDMNNMLLVNGVNFYHDTFLAKYKGIACCDNDAVLTGSPYSVAFDLKNVDSTLGAKTSLAIDKNALLFWSSPAFTNMTPELKSNDTYVWSDVLPRLKYMANGQMNDIYVDVRAQKVCLDGHTDMQWNFEMTLRGNLKVNLANHDDLQGIIKVTQV